MHCTEQELREYINDLKEKVESIEESITSLRSALDTIPNLSVLVKRGIHSFIEDIYEDITKYKDLSIDVEKFTLKEVEKFKVTE